MIKIMFYIKQIFQRKNTILLSWSWCNRMCCCKQIERSKKLEGNCIKHCQLLLYYVNLCL